MLYEIGRGLVVVPFRNRRRSRLPSANMIWGASHNINLDRDLQRIRSGFAPARPANGWGFSRRPVGLILSAAVRGGAALSASGAVGCKPLFGRALTRALRSPSASHRWPSSDSKVDTLNNVHPAADA